MTAVIGVSRMKVDWKEDKLERDWKS